MSIKFLNALEILRIVLLDRVLEQCLIKYIR